MNQFCEFQALRSEAWEVKIPGLFSFDSIKGFLKEEMYSR